MTQAFFAAAPLMMSLKRLMLLTAGLGLLLGAPLAAQAAERIEVKLDQAMVMTIPASVKTMVLGNPAIADITILKSGGKMVITGKSFGDTNVVALDREGNLVLEAAIRVSAPGGKLVVQRGMSRQSYSCNPRCEPTITLGDDQQFFVEAASLAMARGQISKPGGGRE